MDKIKLTQAQRKFLAEYIDEICYNENAFLKDAKRDVFVEHVVKMGFDDGEPRQSLGDVRVAKNLLEKGIFDDVDVHENCAGQGPFLYVSFTELGAHAIFDVMNKGV